MNFKLVAIIIEREQETVVLEKSLQENTQEEDQQFLWLLENMTDAFISVNACWECTSVNHQAEEALGKTQQALVGRTLWEIFPASLATPFYQKAYEVMEQRTVLPCTVSYLPLKRWFTGRMVPFQAGIALFFHDTTSQMQAEQTFQSVAEHIPDIIMRVDAQFRHLYVNAAVTRATGFPPEKFLGQTNRDLGMPEELVAYWDRHLAEVFANAHGMRNEMTGRNERDVVDKKGECL